MKKARGLCGCLYQAKVTARHEDKYLIYLPTRCSFFSSSLSSQLLSAFVVYLLGTVIGFLDLSMDVKSLASLVHDLDDLQASSILIRIKQITQKMMQQIERENRHVEWTPTEQNKGPFDRLNVKEISGRLDVMMQQVHQYPKMYLKIQHSVLLDMQSHHTREDLERNINTLLNPRLYLVHLKTTPKDFAQIEMWNEKVWSDLCRAGLVGSFLSATKESCD